MYVLLQRVGIEEGHRVLDVGFRNAEELRAIAACVGPTGCVTGIDVNPQHVEAVRGELSRLSLGNVAAERRSMLDVPFDDRTFDVVFCKGVLHEVRRIGKAMEEMARLQAGRHPLYRRRQAILSVQIRRLPMECLASRPADRRRPSGLLARSSGALASPGRFRRGSLRGASVDVASGFPPRPTVPAAGPSGAILNPAEGSV